MARRSKATDVRADDIKEARKAYQILANRILVAALDPGRICQLMLAYLQDKKNRRLEAEFASIYKNAKVQDALQLIVPDIGAMSDIPFFLVDQKIAD